MFSHIPNLYDAAEALQNGELVAFPTETVFGLGGDATNDEAVARIFSMKARPQFNPLIVHFSNYDQLQLHVQLNETAALLARHFWPGPLTMVLPRSDTSTVSLLATAGLDTMAVRMPANPLALALIEAAGIPIAAPSANRSGRISPTRPEHVRAEFPHTGLMVMQGFCNVGLESTVVLPEARGVTILRHGGITQAMLEDVLATPVFELSHASTIQSPGQLLKHYAPQTRVRLNAYHPREGEGYLAFGDVPHAAGAIRNLSVSRDVNEAAANLFGMLRELDSLGLEGIAVAPIPEIGIGVAINDRLRRAAAQ